MYTAHGRHRKRSTFKIVSYYDAYDCKILYPTTFTVLLHHPRIQQQSRHRVFSDGVGGKSMGTYIAIPTFAMAYCVCFIRVFCSVPDCHIRYLISCVYLLCTRYLASSCIYRGISCRMCNNKTDVTLTLLQSRACCFIWCNTYVCGLQGDLSRFPHFPAPGDYDGRAKLI